MKSIPKRVKTQSKSFLEDLTYKYLPYWPLFILLAVIFSVMAWAYLRVTKPVFEITATILINDEKKGADEVQLTESLNIPTSKKIVENELEVIKGRKLMDEVVNKLHLYAPLTEKARVKTLSAYVTSPIVIEAAYPDSLKEIIAHIPFTFKNNSVVIKGKAYELNKIMLTPYGLLQFLHNPRYIPNPESSVFSFSLYRTKRISTAILKNLDVSATGKLSSIVKLKMKDEIPQRGEDILNNLLSNYNQSSKDFKNELAKNTLDFLDERLKTVSADLKKVEKQIQVYKSGNGIVNLGDQGRLFLQNVSENDQKMSSLNTKMAVLNQVENYVSSKGSSAGIVPSTMGVDDPMLGKLLDKLYQSETEYNKIKQTAGENNPMAKTLEMEIENLRPGIMENIRNQKSTVGASLGNINSTNNKYNSTLSSIPLRERELINVSREQEVKNSTYAFLLQKREQTALAYSSSIPNSKIIDPAQASLRPVSPGKRIVYPAAMVLALVFTVIFILFKELLTDKILFRSEIENYTTIPIAGEIGSFKKNSYLLAGSDFNNIQHQLRQVRVAIGLQQYKTENNKILITSGIDGEGKSLISIQLALSLSLSGKSVVLIDGDMRNAKVTAVFSLQDKTGFKDYLESAVAVEEIFYPASYANLFIVPAGKAVENGAELLLNGKVEGLIETLKQRFDYILIDSPPVNEEIDAYIVSGFTDITLYIIRHNFTPKQTVKNLDDNLTIKPLNNPAIIFNGIKPRGFLKFTKHSGYGYENIHS